MTKKQREAVKALNAYCRAGAWARAVRMLKVLAEEAKREGKPVVVAKQRSRSNT